MNTRENIITVDILHKSEKIENLKRRNIPMPKGILFIDGDEVKTDVGVIGNHNITNCPICGSGMTGVCVLIDVYAYSTMRTPVGGFINFIAIETKRCRKCGHIGNVHSVLCKCEHCKKYRAKIMFETKHKIKMENLLKQYEDIRRNNGPDLAIDFICNECPFNETEEDGFRRTFKIKNELFSFIIHNKYIINTSDKYIRFTDADQSRREYCQVCKGFLSMPEDAVCPCYFLGHEEAINRTIKFLKEYEERQKEVKHESSSG